MTMKAGSLTNQVFITLFLIFSVVWYAEGAISIPVSGKVTNDSGIVQPNVTVDFCIKNGTGTTVAYSIQTDNQGKFTLADVWENDYQIRITSTLYPIQWFAPVNTTTYPSYIVHAYPTLTDTLIIKLTNYPINNVPASVLRIQVNDSIGNALSGNGQVQLKGKSSGSYISKPLELSNPVEFTSLPADSYSLSFSISPYPYQYYTPNGQVSSSNFSLQIGAHDTISLSVQLTNAPKCNNFINIKLKTPSGTAASGVNALLYNSYNMTTPVASVVSDSLGKISFSYLQQVQYYLKFNNASIPEQWYSYSRNSTTLFPDDPIYAKISPLDTMQVSLSQTPFDNKPRSMLSVQLKDASGNIIKSSGTVALINSNSRIHQPLYFDTVKNEFLLSAISQGEYFLRFELTSFPTQYYSPTQNTMYESYRLMIGFSDTLSLQSTITSTTNTSPGYGYLIVTVLDTTEKPVDSAAITLNDINMKQIGFGTTMNGGVSPRFSIPSSQPTLLNVKSGSYPLQYWSTSGQQAKPSSLCYFSVQAGDTQRITIRLSNTPKNDSVGTKTVQYVNYQNAFISGTVIDSLGKPVDSAKILVLDPTLTTVASIQTINGSFQRFQVPSMKTLLLAVVAPMFPQQYWSPTGLMASPAQKGYFTLQSGDSMTFVLRLTTHPVIDSGSIINNPPGGLLTLSGNIKTIAGSNPVKGVRVVALPSDFGLYGFSPQKAFGQYQTFTDTIGNYLIKGIAPGDYIVLADPDTQNYVAQFFSNSDVPAQATKIHFDSVSVNAKNFSLRAGGTIIGSVVNAAGSPLSGVRVGAHESTGKQWYEVETNSAGKFTIRGLPTSTYKLYTSNSSFIMVNQTLKMDYSVSEGSTITATTIQMQPGGYLAGSFSSSAQLLSNNTVGQIHLNALLFNDTLKNGMVYWPKQNSSLWLTPLATNPNMGSFRSDVIAPGPWRVILTPYTMDNPATSYPVTGYVQSTAWTLLGSTGTFSISQPLVIPSLDTLKNIQLPLKIGYTIYGTIKFEGSTVTPTNWSVSAFTKDSSSYFCISQGRRINDTTFELAGLIDGSDYYLQIGADGYPSQFWSTNGNTSFPSYSYKLNISSFIKPSLTAAKNVINGNSGPDVGKNGPVSLWSTKTDTGLVLYWMTTTTINTDSTFLYTGTQKATGSTILTKSASGQTLYKYVEKRQLTMPVNYCAVFKGKGISVRSNILWVDHRQNISTPSLFLTHYPSYESIHFEWTTDSGYIKTSRDSIVLSRTTGTVWNIIGKQPATQTWFDDRSWTKADSGKTFQYKAEIYSGSTVVRRSSTISVSIDKAFLLSIGSILRVGPYESFKTIQSAIDAASDNDIVKVLHGTYKENLNIGNKKITLEADWQYGKPPTLDAQNGIAITIPYVTSAPGRSIHIGGFKFENASVGVRTSRSVDISQCLFVNVSKALETVPDSIATLRALQADPTIRSSIFTSMWQCTFIAKASGQIVSSLNAIGVAEQASYIGPYSGMGEFYIEPIVSISSQCNVNNSILAYYSSTGAQNTTPIRLTGLSSTANLNNCDYWMTSTAAGTRITNGTRQFTVDPSFIDSQFYMIPQSLSLRTSADNNSSIGYDNRTNNKSSIESVQNLIVRTIGFRTITLKWDRAASTDIAGYKIYRVPGDTSLFFVDQIGEWDLKTSQDSMFKVMDTFSTKNTYFTDTTVMPDSGYLYVVAAINTTGEEGPIHISAQKPLSSYICNKYSYSYYLPSSKWLMVSAWGGNSSQISPSATQTWYQWDDHKTPDKLYSQYGLAAELKPGLGYWIKSGKDTLLTVSKSSLTALIAKKDSLAIPLTHDRTGWNQISSPYPFPISPDWVNTFTIWEWNSDSSGYSRATQLSPWNAYWIYTERDTILPLSRIPLVSTSSLARTKTNGHQWEIQLSLKGKKTWDPDNYIGVTSSFAKKQSDVMEPPQMFGSTQMYFVKVDEANANRTQLSSEYKTTSIPQKEHLEWMVGVSASKEPTTIDMRGIETVPEGTSIFWVDNRGVFDLRALNKIEIPAHESDRFGYIVATTDPSKLALFSNKLSLLPIYPNPFRGSATIQFTVPYEWNSDGSKITGNKKLTIAAYDIAGRLVAKLFEGPTTVGAHRIVWTGKEGNRYIPNGYYMIKLTYKKSVKSTKLIKVR